MMLQGRKIDFKIVLDLNFRKRDFPELRSILRQAKKQGKLNVSIFSIKLVVKYLIFHLSQEIKRRDSLWREIQRQQIRKLEKLEDKENEEIGIKRFQENFACRLSVKVN